MLLETSTTMAIAMPSRWTLVASTPHCGRASAMIARISTAARSQGRARRSRAGHDGGRPASPPSAG